MAAAPPGQPLWLEPPTLWLPPTLTLRPGTPGPSRRPSRRPRTARAGRTRRARSPRGTQRVLLVLLGGSPGLEEQVPDGFHLVCHVLTSLCVCVRGLVRGHGTTGHARHIGAIPLLGRPDPPCSEPNVPRWIRASVRSARSDLCGDEVLMTYFLGVDLGTTYTAAAVHRDGRDVHGRPRQAHGRHPVRGLPAGRRDDPHRRGGEPAGVSPSRSGGPGVQAAGRRHHADPPRRRAVQRRGADGRLLRWVVDAVTEREGRRRPASVSPPGQLGAVQAGPAAPGDRLADLDDVVTITEPEAAVPSTTPRRSGSSRARRRRLRPRRRHVRRRRGAQDGRRSSCWAAGGHRAPRRHRLRRGGLRPRRRRARWRARGARPGRPGGDGRRAPAARAECVEAKEALSADTEVSIPVLLPNVSTEVRLTRAEFEAMIRPPLADSMTAMRRALRSAGVDPGPDAVLLVGGSSRIPLVAQMVGAELGRPPAAVPPRSTAGPPAAAGVSGGSAAATRPPPPGPPPSPRLPPVLPPRRPPDRGHGRHRPGIVAAPADRSAPSAAYAPSSTPPLPTGAPPSVPGGTPRSRDGRHRTGRPNRPAARAADPARRRRRGGRRRIGVLHLRRW